MKRSSVAFAVAASIAALGTSGAIAQSLPAVKADGANKVPECATPGRLMAFLAERNSKLDQRFSGIATAYMRHGEELGLRWDYAFFQMILETGNLAYKRGNGKPGDVKPTQNNFAGLGATGKGEPGETFATVEDGVRAHLQHLQMYSGESVDSPIAERTRKVQEWGVLTSWQKGFKRPITYADLAAKWAPGSKGYGSDVKSIAGNFYDGFCDKPDPRPELVQEARSGRAASTKVARQEPARSAERSPGAELARKAVERARAEGDGTRSALGARPTSPTKVVDPAPVVAAPVVTVLNEAAVDVPAGAETPANSVAQQSATVHPAAAATQAKTPAAKAAAGAVAAANTVVAAVSPKAPPAATAPQPGKCRVWTASYGGQKSVVIRSAAEQFTNFTVLDVNEGQEAREIEAYIAAYAKGGHKVGEFPSQNAALDKAFQLCPEG